MTKYVKLVNNEIEYAPANYENIINFNKDPDIMFKYGFKPLVENEKPKYDSTYQELEHTYTETSSEVVEHWEVVEYKTIEQLIEERKTNFYNEFLETSLGNYRLKPSGYANAQQSIDTVNNIVDKLGNLTEDIAKKIIFYQTPDFSNAEECTEEWLIAHQVKADVMTKEEWDKFYIEFSTLYAQNQYEN